ncbi:MAG: hypothetical protein ABL904_12700 [Hyphomicrobiaceae bacterium]
MTLVPRPQLGDTPNDIAIQASAGDGGRITAIVSAIALIFSAYSLWDSSLKAPDLKVFVPPVIHYSSPYNNSNFEVFAIPVTVINDGGRTGTVLSIDLEVTSIEAGEPKRFYAADFGRWAMDKTRSNAYQPFAPISLAGKASRTETLLFYPKSDKEKPEQLVGKAGKFRFKLILDEAEADDFGVLDRPWSRRPTSVAFDMELRYFDARAFQNGTLPMHSLSGRSARSGEEAAPRK